MVEELEVVRRLCNRFDTITHEYNEILATRARKEAEMVENQVQMRRAIGTLGKAFARVRAAHNLDAKDNPPFDEYVSQCLAFLNAFRDLDKVMGKPQEVRARIIDIIQYVIQIQEAKGL